MERLRANGRTGASGLRPSIKIQFANVPSIKISVKFVMKSSTSIQNGTSDSPPDTGVTEATSHGFQDRTTGELSRQNGTLKTLGRTVETKPEYKVIKLTKIEFHLAAPFAKSVKLVANFTGWEKYALDMIKCKAGIWHTIVPLPPGIHPYGFLVDGEWCDAPSPAQRVHNNPFGWADAIVKIASEQMQVLPDSNRWMVRNGYFRSKTNISNKRKL